MHQDSTGRVHSGIASQISFAVGNALRNPDQFRSVPLIGELGRVVKHENKIVRCRYTLTRGLEMARQNVSFADAMIGKKTVGRLRIRPILANERNTLPYVAADPLKQCAKSLAKPRIPKLAPGDFTINPRCCKTGDSIDRGPFVRSRGVKPWSTLPPKSGAQRRIHKGSFPINFLFPEVPLKRIRNCG